MLQFRPSALASALLGCVLSHADVSTAASALTLDPIVVAGKRATQLRTAMPEVKKNLNWALN